MDAAEGVSGRIKDADAVGVGRRKDDKMPTQSVLAGTKTTRPSPAVAAPTNLKYSVSLDEMSTQTKRSDFGSKMPTVREGPAQLHGGDAHPRRAARARAREPHLRLASSSSLRRRSGRRRPSPRELSSNFPCFCRRRPSPREAVRRRGRDASPSGGVAALSMECACTCAPACVPLRVCLRCVVCAFV